MIDTSDGPPLRVLLVAPNVPLPGTHGGSAHVMGVASALAKRHAVMVIARVGSSARAVSGATVLGAGLGTARPGGVLALRALHCASSIGAVRRFRPDVICERNSAQGLGAALGRRLSVPVVTTVIDPDVERLSVERASCFVTTDVRLVPPGRRGDAHAVTWGVDPHRFHPSADGESIRRELRLRADDVVVTYAGAFYPWHDLRTLVLAAERCIAARGVTAPRLRFVLVGGGRDAGSIARLVRRRGLSSSFTFVGRVPHVEVPRYLAASDVCVAPYDPERHPRFADRGMIYDPIKVLEGLAAARPVITLDAPNLRRSFRDGEHLVLTPRADVGALAARISRLADDPDLRERLGKQGRALVCRSMTWAHHAEALTAIFRSVIADAGGPRGEVRACAGPVRPGRAASRRRFPWREAPGSAPS